MTLYKFADVISGKVPVDRYGNFTTIKIVSWEGVEPIWVDWTFRTIGNCKVPTCPTLPKYFNMAEHPEWSVIEAKIKDGIESASFEVCDLMYLDLEDLAELMGSGSYADCCDYQVFDFRSDWNRWSCSFDDNWSDFFSKIEKLAEFSIPHLPLEAPKKKLEKYIKEKGLQCEPIGNRVNPPTLKEALQLMMDNLEKFEAKQ